MGLLDRFFGKKQPHLAEKQLQLAEVVELTSLAVMANCTTQVRAIIHQNTMLPTLGSNPDEFNKDAWDIVLELIAFSLHLADRIAFNAVGPEKRSLFMDALLGSTSFHLTQSILTDTSSEARQRFQTGFLTLYGERTGFYAPLQIPSDGEAPVKGTLFWEAAKGVANAYFPNDVAAATLILSIRFGACVDGLKDLSARLAAVHDL
jgi:hypothetical protein